VYLRGIEGKCHWASSQRWPETSAFWSCHGLEEGN